MNAVLPTSPAELYSMLLATREEERAACQRAAEDYAVRFKHSDMRRYSIALEIADELRARRVTT